MPSLNERLRQLEQMHTSEDALLISLAAIEPEQLAGVLREGIVALERECSEGRGNDPFRSSTPRRNGPSCPVEALPLLRTALADLEVPHGAPG